jgi:hypothetical protein
MALKYIFGQDELVADFVARSKIASGAVTRASFPDKNLRAIGIANADNELIAGIVYFSFNPDAGTIEMSVEALRGHRWLTPSTLALMFQYPFIGCGCQMLITKTMARNQHILRMLSAMNFTLILHPRAGGRHEDGVVAQLTYEDWLESKFCKRYKHHIVENKAEAA